MDYVREGWLRIKNSIDVIDGVYTLDETIRLLTDEFHYKNYFGRAKNRTMIKENPKLYKSIYTHSSILEDVMKQYNRYKGTYNFTNRMVFLVERNCDIDSLKCECGKTYGWTLYCRHCPEPKKTWSGKTHTKHTKKKQRISALRYIHSAIGQFNPRYNPSSIPIIEAKANELGITDLQHAENGGEFYIKELGYWVDGYSKEKNIVIEYDEPHHKRQVEKDMKRQNEITEYLNCKFIRINDE